MRKRRSTRVGRRGFTLLELMAVVGIMGVLFAVAIPQLAGIVQRSDRSGREAAAQADRDQRSLRLQEERPPAAPSEGLPVYKSAAIDIRLAATQRRYGFDVYTRTSAEVRGRFIVGAPPGRGQGVQPLPRSLPDMPGRGGGSRVHLDFPFPLGTTEARDVFLFFLTPSGKVEAPGAVYDRAGIHWTGALPPGRETTLETTYSASGGDRFVYRLLPAARVRALRISLDLEGVPAFSVPDHALQPTSEDGRRLVWEAGNLVSDRPIIVDIPEAGSPISRVFLLFRLVAPALLLFGAGFWYVWELYDPGRTERFRWGDFLLLASTYSLFFLNFAVLGLKGQAGTPAALALAGALSLPLLALHAARLVDWRFALTRAVPLGVFTLGVMVNFVYGGESREYVFLACVLSAVAFLTATYPGKDRLKLRTT